MPQQQIDYAGLVQAVVLLITAVTLAINLWNQRRIAEIRDITHQINGNTKKDVDTQENLLE